MLFVASTSLHKHVLGVIEEQAPSKLHRAKATRSPCPQGVRHASVKQMKTIKLLADDFERVEEGHAGSEGEQRMRNTLAIGRDIGNK